MTRSPGATGHASARFGIDLRPELRAIVRLAVPVMTSRAGLLVMTTVDTVMTGWVGGQELAFLAIGLAPFVFVMLIGTGLLTGTVVLVAQAHGAREAASCGHIWHGALVESLLFGMLAIAVLWHSEAALLAFGQSPAIAAGGAEVAWMLALGMPAMLGYIATTLFLEGLGRPEVGVAVIAFGNLLNIALNWLLIYGGVAIAPDGAAGAALATTIARWVMLGLIMGYALLAPSVRRYGPAGRFRPDWRLQVKLLRLGGPFAVSQGLETGAFQSLTLFCGWLGATALAAYQIALNLTALVFMATVGLATATAIRVGSGIGAGAPARALTAAWLGVGVTLAVMLTLAPLIVLGADGIAALYTTDGAVRELAGRSLWLVALVIVVDGAQGTLTGGLRGAADVWPPMAIHVTSFWLVLVPAAWLLAFPAGLGVAGLLAGVVAGLVVAALLLAWRLARLPRRRLERV